MKPKFTAAIFLLLSISGIAMASTNFLPAGLPIACTMQEDNFSIKTAEVGDPTICYLPMITGFNGRPIFPRGSYLTGHLVSGKKPGRLFGKGDLVIAFDRAVVSNTIRIPISVKVIAAPKYHVSADGKILGKGHRKRDIAEWMLPPLWPIDALTLLRRGPYPAMKGKEERLLLRVMQDALIPSVEGATSYYADSNVPGVESNHPTYYENPVHVGGDVVLIRKDGSAVYTIDYWYSVPGVVSYVLKGNLFGKMPLAELNLKETKRINEQRGIRFKIVR
jgi:hypothetical protein